jgi:hypothetical protein
MKNYASRILPANVRAQGVIHDDGNNAKRPCEGKVRLA